MSAHTQPLSWYARLLRWFRTRRESKRLALIAEAANLVIQQLGVAWTGVKCPKCLLYASRDTSNYCDWCGASLVPPEPDASEPPIAYYEQPDQRTSSIRLSAIRPLAPAFTPPERPHPTKRPLLGDRHFIPMIRTQKVTSQQKEQARQHIRKS